MFLFFNHDLGIFLKKFFSDEYLYDCLSQTFSVEIIDQMKQIKILCFVGKEGVMFLIPDMDEQRKQVLELGLENVQEKFTLLLKKLSESYAFKAEECEVIRMMIFDEEYEKIKNKIKKAFEEKKALPEEDIDAFIKHQLPFDSLMAALGA